MDQASPSGTPRRPSGPELLKEIWHVVQDLPFSSPSGPTLACPQRYR